MGEWGGGGGGGGGYPLGRTLSHVPDPRGLRAAPSGLEPPHAGQEHENEFYLGDS